jgi:hypothetical protein
VLDRGACRCLQVGAGVLDKGACRWGRGGGLQRCVCVHYRALPLCLRTVLPTVG